MRYFKLTSCLLVVLICTGSLFSNTQDTFPYPISHCYHWLDESKPSTGYLTFKYNYAKRNEGAMSFKTTDATSKGAVAGPGIYCAKSPVGSYSYGDRVVRIEFIEDVVMYDDLRGNQYCGYGDFKEPNQAKCDRESWDVKHFSSAGPKSRSWYVIRNPKAIARWSANSHQLEKDLIANKNKSPGAFGQHAVNTLNAIRKERSRMNGEWIIENKRAKFAIIKKLNDKNYLNKFPPLYIIAKIATSPSKREVSAKLINDTYFNQFIRALEDYSLPYDDIAEVFEKYGSSVKKQFINAVKSIGPADFGHFNPSVLLVAYDKNREELGANNSTLKGLWEEILTHKDANIRFLLDAEFSSDALISQSFFNTLSSPENLLSQLAKHNQGWLLSIFDHLLTSSDFAEVNDFITEIVKNSLFENRYDIVKAIEGLKSPKIDKAQVTADALTYVFKDNGFDKNGRSPIYLGNVYDFAVKKLDGSTSANILAKLKSMPISADVNILTYQLLDDLKKKRYSLPSFLKTNDYLGKLFYRVVGERDPKFKNKTNAYRFMFSDLFHYYFPQINILDEDEKDKRDALLKSAQSFYYSLAQELIRNQESGRDNRNLAYSYAYTTLQNSGFYHGKMKNFKSPYKRHPMEHLVFPYAKAYYSDKSSSKPKFRDSKTGRHSFNKYLSKRKDADVINEDIQYDLLFEWMQQYSVDGSYLKFLFEALTDNHIHDKVFKGRYALYRSSRIKRLIKLILDQIATPEYREFLQSEEFKISFKEKKAWKNIIDKVEFYSDGKERRKGQYEYSSECYAAKILHKYRKTIDELYVNDQKTLQYVKLFYDSRVEIEKPSKKPTKVAVAAEDGGKADADGKKDEDQKEEPKEYEFNFFKNVCQ